MPRFWVLKNDAQMVLLGNSHCASPFPGGEECSLAARALSWFHRITECSGLEGTPVGHLVQPPCRSRVTYSGLHRTLSRRVLNISREGDSTTSLGSLFQCSVTLRGKKFFLGFSWSFPGFSLCPLPLVLSLGTTAKSLTPSPWPPPCRYLEAFRRSPLNLLFSRLNKPSSLSLSS